MQMHVQALTHFQPAGSLSNSSPEHPPSGDGTLRPFSLHAALGQALLFASVLPDLGPAAAAAGVGKSVAGQAGSSGSGSGSSSSSSSSVAVSGRSTASAFSGDAYEEHFLLLGNHVLIITSRRLVMLLAPGGCHFCGLLLGGGWGACAEV